MQDPMQNPEAYLTEIAARLIRMTEEAYPDPRHRHHMTEPPGITDDDWLGLVAIAFCQNYGLIPSYALDAVTSHRSQIIAARRQGADPVEIVHFVWETFGPPPPCAFERRPSAPWN